MCQLAVEHTSLSQDKLNALLQTQLKKPELAAFVNEDPADSDSDLDVEEEFVEETIKAPSL